MPGTVRLLVTAGPIRGQRFEFAGHDTFLFGRAPDCHGRLDASDAAASRHHFLLEVNPPLARLRDLGSLNGTRVNGVRHGGRQRGESPEDAAARGGAEVDLHDGDEIRVGATVIEVKVERPASPLEALVAEADPETGGGETVGPYEIDRLLGKGGMGAVYLARHRDGGPPVALKVMLPKMVVDEAVQEIFVREIEVTRALRHPNVVALLDFGQDAGRFYFALEYCGGGSVEALRVRLGGRVPLPTLLRIAVDALEGLAAAHECGFVHRDIKPDNVLLDQNGTARLADFGLAKSFQQAGLSGLTATGVIGGTLFFMAREQLTSYREARPTTDVWSMAATLYFLLTGQYAREFGDGDPIAAILRGGTVPLRRRDPSVPEDFAGVIDRALDDEPARRFSTAREFGAAIRGVL
jgi:serine/threonine protein kinase